MEGGLKSQDAFRAAPAALVNLATGALEGAAPIEFAPVMGMGMGKGGSVVEDHMKVRYPLLCERD